MIGRSDYQLVAPPIPDLPDWIIQVCRRKWPDGVFLDANETELIPLSSPKLAWRPQSEEFFILVTARQRRNGTILGRVLRTGTECFISCGNRARLEHPHQ